MGAAGRRGLYHAETPVHTRKMAGGSVSGSRPNRPAVDRRAAPPADLPKSGPDRPRCRPRHAARPPAQAASNAGICCASSPAQKPASTSPEPAVASQAEALSAIAARPSGAATTVSPPFSSTTAPVAAAAARARASFDGACSRLVQLAEQAAELAFVRRQQHRRLPGFDRGRRARQVAREARQRVGIEHHGGARRERRQHQLAHARPDPAAGPEHGDVAPGIGQEVRERTRVIDRAAPSPRGLPPR